jgi:23S rRNA (adenine2503-C2)-methyltransferase
VIDVHDGPGLEAVRSRMRLDPHRLKRLRVQLLKNHRGTERALQELPSELRAEFAAQVRFHHLELAHHHDSQIDGATKLVFRTDDDLRIETVILRARTGRTALCVSSQVGCGVGCDFCATGRLGARRNLTHGEVLDQVVQANARLATENRHVRNIVFMGMGEPLHNEAVLHKTLESLTQPSCFDIAPAHICVSTVGIPDAMVRCAQRFPRVRMALSLHSARQEVRSRLIPLARHHDLLELRRAVAEVTRLQGQPIMLEHLLLENLNDGDEDLEALVDWIGDLPVHINLIPYNPIPDAPSLGSTPKPRREAFANELKSRGFRVTLRYSLGADVTAACGQLVRDENRREARR